MQGHLKTAQATAQTKVFKRACKDNPRQNCFKKFPTLQKKIKNATHSRYSMTQKLNTDNYLQGRWTRTTGYNSTYPKVAVHWLNQALSFYQSLCLVDSELLRNRHLRVAAFQDKKQAFYAKN